MDKDSNYMGWQNENLQKSWQFGKWVTLYRMKFSHEQMLHNLLSNWGPQANYMVMQWGLSQPSVRSRNHYRTVRKFSCSPLPLLAYTWMLCRNLDVTFRKDAFEQSSVHSVELEQGGKDSDLHQMKTKIHDVWPEEGVQEDYYQHQILAGIEILFMTWRVELEQWA